MTPQSFVLVHGAGSDSWFWHLVEPELRRRGHDVVAPDLPCDDDSAGLAEYAEAVVAATGDRRGVVLVAQSFGAFTAPLVSERLDARLLVLLNAMVPRPGEPPGEWWANTRWEGSVPETAEALRKVFFHDVPAGVTAAAMTRGRPQSGTPFELPWPLDRWPDVPTRALVARDDRFFPLGLQRRVHEERLGVVPDEIDGGHLVALSRPAEVAERLCAYASNASPRRDSAATS